jgi:hypothetical protein
MKKFKRLGGYRGCACKRGLCEEREREKKDTELTIFVVEMGRSYLQYSAV